MLICSTLASSFTVYSNNHIVAIQALCLIIPQLQETKLERLKMLLFQLKQELVLPDAPGWGTFMLASSPLRSGTFQLRQWELPKLTEWNTCDHLSVSLMWVYTVCGYAYLIHLDVLVSLPSVYCHSPKIASLKMIQSTENFSPLRKGISNQNQGLVRGDVGKWVTGGTLIQMCSHITTQFAEKF